MATRIQSLKKSLFKPVQEWLKENYDGFEGDWDASLLNNYLVEFDDFHEEMKRDELINIPKEYQRFFNYGGLYDDMVVNGELHAFYVWFSPPMNVPLEYQHYFADEFPCTNSVWVIQVHCIDDLREEIALLKPEIAKYLEKEDCSDSCDCITEEEIVIASTPSCGDCGAPTEITVAGDTDCLNTICPAGVMAV
jgi:hypothetical protein